MCVRREEAQPSWPSDWRSVRFAVTTAAPTATTAVQQPFSFQSARQWSPTASQVASAWWTMVENRRRRLLPPPLPARPDLAEWLEWVQDLEAADRAARLERVQVDVPDWVRDAAPPGWTAHQRGVEETMMWIACLEGSEGEWCEHMVIAKCQECGRVVQTPRGRDAAPSDHCWENWPLACNEEHGGIYCSEECMLNSES